MARSDGTPDGSESRHSSSRPQVRAPDGFPPSLQPLLARIADRRAARTEATLQADIRQLLLAGDFGLFDSHLDVDLEAPVGGGRRIDIEVGYTIIEVKRRLQTGRPLLEAERQLGGYVRSRSLESGQRYVGILTDGGTWRAYQLTGDALTLIDTHTMAAIRPDGLALFYWLEGVLATSQRVRPAPAEVARRLGAQSTSHKLDRAALAALYAEHQHLPTVQLKRKLWAELLDSALGTQFVDDPDLFVEHTLLMNSAYIIAHLVVGIDALELQPHDLITGQRFDKARILGVVEHDFFGWTTEVPGGREFIQGLTRRLARFDWLRADHDILKVLYESMIGPETRKRMGEYYTPDWLAEHLVDTVVTDPLRQRVLDPACGSGTFLFHAVRRYLAAAETADVPLDAALTQLTHHVVGVDLHPVAVALARVTYLLAIGHQRLTDQRGPITIPVYLGDSMQWRQRRDLFTEEHVRISAGYSTSEVEEWLRFPKRLLDEPSRFDQIVAGLASLAAKPRDPDNPPSLAAFFHHMRIGSEDQPMIRGTFEVMCRLHDEGRDHIWSYYLRNLARPVWLAMDDNRMHVLISNPPWLSYRHMPRDMQTRLRELSRDRGLWRGREFATNQDLSALFVTRAVQQYLRDDGSFAFVLPNSVLDREYFEGFGRGWYEDTVEPTAVAFTGSLDLRRLRPHPFPRGACVVFGDRATLSTYRRLPSVTERWTGRLPTDAKSWQQVEPLITREAADVVAGGSALTESPYKPRFAQGATIVPRVLFFVETDTGGRLGLGAGRHAVRSARSNLEKAPWKELPALEGVVESEFIRPVLLGESLLPYRILPAKQAVLPLDGSTLMTGPGSRLDYHFGLAEWWRKAEATWEAYRSSARLTLAERLDFHRGLSAQFPAPPLRLVYSASGAPIATLEEGLFLSAILNSSVLTELVRPMMSYGKDERDIDKHAWNLPIPQFDDANALHHRLAELGRQQSETVAEMHLTENTNFVALRRHVRAGLARHPATPEIEAVVMEVLG
ncbi:class I SAM-dependent methyltransferase [Micromonospora purpureochromogenes]|uniref:SAM-dependent methyltransferase n=1 Tax=Micromonospora purpureochromogenes TaxID=47872 RepID=A0ABX2RVR7_9ACTN|nr:class I SAM-dependent methyltransferase [Micromonospora purpureochromogenes]NYF59354.1 SAM-dependent methyltransferase [Micromonospora purpureochromogenes]